jgi:biopolymer transport protein ExbD
MKIKNPVEFKSEVATASLNDIMFFLLLFFLIISTFANPHVIKLLLPRADSSQTVSKKQITLSVNKEKQYFMDNKLISFENMEEELANLSTAIPDATIVVRADYSLTIQDLVDILQLGSKLRIKKILATEKHTS